MIYEYMLMRLRMQIKKASKEGRNCFIPEEIFNIITVSAVAVRTKHIAVIVFIGIQWGIRFSKRVTLNTHPERSRQLKANTTAIAIHIALR